MSSAAVTLRVHGAIADIEPADWDACAGGDNPFLAHTFLEALETSGCVRPETGWAPRFPNLAAITFEYHESYHKRLGIGGVARELDLMHDLADRVAEARRG